MSRPPIPAAAMSLGFALFLAELHAFETVDAFAMYEWARPQIEALRFDFYQSKEPADNFPLWVRVQYLARAVTA